MKYQPRVGVWWRLLYILRRNRIVPVVLKRLVSVIVVLLLAYKLISLPKVVECLDWTAFQIYSSAVAGKEVVVRQMHNLRNRLALIYEPEVENKRGQSAQAGVSSSLSSSEQIEGLRLQLRIAEQEIIELRRLLRYADHTQYKLVTARIIAASLDLEGQHFILSAGSEDGVVEGSAVVNGNGLVGKVVKVKPHFSRLSLIGAKGIRFPVILLQSSQQGVVGESLGIFDNKLKLLHVADATLLRDGEEIITSAEGGKTPRGILVGTLGIESDDFGPGQSILKFGQDVLDIDAQSSPIMHRVWIKPAVDFNNIDILTILVPQQDVSHY